MVTGRKAGRRMARGVSVAGAGADFGPGRPREGKFGGGGVGAGTTGTRTTVPQAQPDSGAGHSSCRPQTSQRTSTHEACQVRCSISTGTPPRSTGRVSGAPHAHGKVGGVKAFSRRHVGHRTGTLSAMVGSCG